VLVPEDIEDAIRERSKRRSLSEIASELLCRGLNIDPRTYGIEPPTEKPRTPEPAAANA
jgi:hypothetical protein